MMVKCNLSYNNKNNNVVGEFLFYDSETQYHLFIIHL